MSEEREEPPPVVLSLEEISYDRDLRQVNRAVNEPRTRAINIDSRLFKTVIDPAVKQQIPPASQHLHRRQDRPRQQRQQQRPLGSPDAATTSRPRSTRKERQEGSGADRSNRNNVKDFYKSERKAQGFGPNTAGKGGEDANGRERRLLAAKHIATARSVPVEGQGQEDQLEQQQQQQQRSAADPEASMNGLNVHARAFMPGGVS